MTPPSKTREPLANPASPATLTAIVADNVHRLRTAQAWSQTDLSRLLRAQGLVDWSPSTVTLVEQGKRRCDHLLELTALCRCFGVGLAELLAGPPEQQVITSGEPIPLGAVDLAFAGQVAKAEIASLPDTDDPYDIDRVARLLHLTRDQFTYLLYDVYEVYSFNLLRDQVAGLKAEHRHTSAEPNTRGRRGRATRLILAKLQERLAAEPMVLIQQRAERAMRAAKENDGDTE